MQLVYLLINLGIILFPLLFAFEKRIFFIGKIQRVAVTTIVVGCIFVVWDAIAVMRNHWLFSPYFVLPFRFFGLPLEELLFFVTVPFSCLFIYEVLVYVLETRATGPRDATIGGGPFLLLSGVMVLLALMVFPREYSFVVFLFTGIVMFLVSWFGQELVESKVFWVYLAVTFVLFFCTNLILTWLPIVLYNPFMITNLRLVTIPIEDIFYNFSLVSLYVLVYTHAKNFVSVSLKGHERIVARSKT